MVQDKACQIYARTLRVAFFQFGIPKWIKDPEVKNAFGGCMIGAPPPSNVIWGHVPHSYSHSPRLASNRPHLQEVLASHSI